MSKEKLYGLRDQLSKFLYDPTPDQAAWRDKMWEEGRFDESIKITKQVETQLEEVETQIEAFEAAEPELGQKIVANTLLNLPLGKQLKGTGLGSLLGLAEEELGAAETQRLDDIKKEINQLNAIRQRDLEGGKVTSGTTRKIDADIRALENEGENILQMLQGETQRLKDIEQKLNSLKKREGTAEEQVKTGLLTLEEGKEATKKLYSDIRALENEARVIEGKPPLTERQSETQRMKKYYQQRTDIEDLRKTEERKVNLFKEFIKDKTDLTFAEEEFYKAYPEFGSPSTRQLTPEQILEELGAQEGTVYDEELLKNAEGLAKSMGISTEDLQNALQQGEKEGLMSLIGKTPTTRERIAHFTLPGNAAKILEEGYDATLPPVHGTGGLQGGPKEGKAGGDILYFTTDEGRWSEAIIYVGEGEGNISRDVYDYDKQKWGEDKNAYKKVNLEKVEAVIKENARTLTIDSWEAADAFEINPERHKYEFIEDIVNKAKAEGYDIVNLKNSGGTAWHSPEGIPNKYGEKDWYGLITGGSGEDDYFILNKEVVEMVAPEIKDTPKKGYQSGGLIMNYGDYGRSYT